MTDNVVDFTKYLSQREETEVEETDELENLHQWCTELCNEMLNSLNEDYNIDTREIEYSPEIIFFFEAFKGLMLKCSGHWHPFQDMAKDFFVEQGISIEESPDGNYKFVIKGMLDNKPANDE